MWEGEMLGIGSLLGGAKCCTGGFRMGPPRKQLTKQLLCIQHGPS